MIQIKRQWETVQLSGDQSRSKTNINQELEEYFLELIPLTSIDDLKVLNETLLEDDKRAFFVSCYFYDSCNKKFAKLMFFRSTS